MDAKPVAQRVTECISIRSQLQSLGLLALPRVSRSLTRHMNDFVATGGADTFEVACGEGVRVRVVLTSRPDRQSGVELIRGH
jgi:hypothetical protein